MPTTTTGKVTDLITFSRGTLATVTDADGKIKWAPHNLLPASEQFDASAWTRNSTVTANNAAAPNGTTTAELVDEGTASGYKQIQQTVSTTAGVNYTLSIFAKYVSCRWLNLSLFDNNSSSQYAAASFDLQNGVVGNSGVAGTGYAIVGTPSMTALTGGWYLCSVTVTNGTSVANRFAFSPSDVGTIGSSGLNTYTGASKTFNAWGASLTRADLGGMQSNPSAYPMYNPSTPRNLAGYSEDWSNAAWTKPGIVAFGSGSTTNAVAAPNGSMTADFLVETATSAQHAAYQMITVSASGTFTGSVYAKTAGRRYMNLMLVGNGGGTEWAAITADLTGGTITSNYSGAGGTYISSSITSVGDGWYRIAITGKVGTLTSLLFSMQMVTSPTPSLGAYGATAYAGDGTSGIYLWGAQLSDSASLDPYVPNFGAAPSAAAAHGARLDYRNGSALGLLVEEARTNLLQRTAEFNSSPWEQVDITSVTANNAVAPDGTTTADTITFSANAGSRIFQGVSTASPSDGSTATFSLWMKGTGTISINIDTYASSGGTEVAVTLSSTWTRYTVSHTFSGSPSGVYRAMIVKRSGQTATAVDAWGAQLETGLFATSYLPNVNTAAGVTRNADVASVGVSQFPYSASEGTLVVNADLLTVPSGPNGLAVLSDGTQGNHAALIALSANRMEWYIRSGANNVADFVTSKTFTANQPFKTAAAYKLNDFAISADGAAPATNTGTPLPVNVSVLDIGSYIGAFRMNGHIRQLTYLPRRLTNAELQSRTL